VKRQPQVQSRRASKLTRE